MQTIDLVEDDCVIVLLQPTMTPQSNVPTEYVPPQVNTILPTSALQKTLRTITESQQLAVLANFYNIHFEQYLNERKKTVIQIIP